MSKKLESAEDIMLDMIKGAQPDAQGAETEGSSEDDKPTIEEIDDAGKEEPENEDVEKVDTNEPAVQSDKADGDGLIEDWIEDEPDPVETKASEVDFSSLAKELGFEATTKEEFISAVKKAAEPKTQENIFAGLPDDLREALTLAKSDGDYLEYLKVKQANYDGYDNLTLIEYAVKDAFADEQGNIDSDGLNEYLENLSEVDVKIQGNRIRNELKSAQQARVRQYNDIAEGKKLAAEKELRSAIDSMKDVGGFKVHSSHKQKLFNDIHSGEALEKMLRKPDGSYDYAKIADAYFKLTYFDKMLGYHRQRAATEQKREILEDRYNVNPKGKEHLPKPDTSADKNDPLGAWIKQLQGSA